MIGLNGIGFIIAIYITDGFIRAIQCTPIDRSNTFRNKIFILFGYFYLISKFADLFDTVFFVLRKKTTHITTLHLFHHTMMPLFGNYIFFFFYATENYNLISFN